MRVPPDNLLYPCFATEEESAGAGWDRIFLRYRAGMRQAEGPNEFGGRTGGSKKGSRGADPGNGAVMWVGALVLGQGTRVRGF